MDRSKITPINNKKNGIFSGEDEFETGGNND